MSSRRGDIRTFVRQQLDERYDAVAGPTLDAIKRDIPTRELDQLDQRAAELDAEGKRFTAGDASLIVFSLTLAEYLRRTRSRVDEVALSIQETGVDATQELELAKALMGVTGSLEQRVRAAWVNPSSAVLSQAVSYTSGQAFVNSLDRFEINIATVAQNIIINGIQNGWNPRRTARELRNTVTTLPAHYANSLLRSLQLTSYRDAAVLHQLANADILEGSIRIAALDDRTCAACIALHGTFLQLGERVDDHRNGRCTSVPVVRGGNYGEFLSGPEWFDELDPEAQAMLAPFRRTPAKLAALRAGAISWNDMVDFDTDPVFGEIVHEASLSGILGSAAEQFYL